MKLLEALRNATRQSHEALHHHPLLAPLLRPDLTLSDWHYSLLAFELFYRTMEANRRDRRSQGVPDAPVLDWLRHDIGAIGVRPLEGSLNAPLVDGEARLLGYLYLKQGSTLGGTVISKNLDRVLALRAGQEQRFFAGYGHETGAQWREFVNALDQRAATCPHEEIIEMAKTAFETVVAACDAAHALKRQKALSKAH